MKTIKLALSSICCVAALAMLSGCSDSAQSDSQQQGERVTESYATKLTNAQPYPLAQMNDSGERANLRERLLRMNNPNKVGYIYFLTQNGQIISTYTVKGKVSSTMSQLTNTQKTVEGTTTGEFVAVDSMGDDGSYGPEEGGQNGIFFFTTNGVLVEWNGLWIYSDAPLNLTSKPLITVDASAKPSSTAGAIK